MHPRQQQQRPAAAASGFSMGTSVATAAHIAQKLPEPLLLEEQQQQAKPAPADGQQQAVAQAITSTADAAATVDTAATAAVRSILQQHGVQDSLLPNLSRALAPKPCYSVCAVHLSAHLLQKRPLTQVAPAVLQTEAYWS